MLEDVIEHNSDLQHVQYNLVMRGSSVVSVAQEGVTGLQICGVQESASKSAASTASPDHVFFAICGLASGQNIGKHLRL